MLSRHIAVSALVIVAQFGSPRAADTVTLTNAAGDENGVVAWGSRIQETGVGISPVDIGKISKGVTHIASCVVGHPPALDDSFTWTPGDDDAPLTYPEPFRVSIKLWVLCANAGCTSPMDPAVKTTLDACFVWANERLREERAGFSLEQSGGDAWISDETATTDSTLTSLRQFDTQRDCPKNLSKASRILSVDHALNVFMVESVDGETGDGNSCDTQDRAILGHDVSCGTFLHELGHNFSLGHVWTGMGGEKNIMRKWSDTRELFTAGQVFRIAFSDTSGLNGTLTKNPNPTPWPASRNCDGSAKQNCPPIDLMLWGTP